MIFRTTWALCAVLLFACGDDGQSAIDASPTPDSGDPAVDAAPGPDAAPQDPLDGAGNVELIQAGFMFLEGPHWRSAAGVVLFSDIPANTIYRLTLPDTIDVFLTPSGNSNGLATATDGTLLVAEHGNRRVSKRRDDGSIVDEWGMFMGSRLNSPNDIAVRSDGTIYFTDPPFGINPGQQELAFNGVFRVDTAGQVIAEVQRPVENRPNGVSLSPDQTVLYVADTQLGAVHAYDVASDGSLSGERAFASDTPNADGMAVDTAGNLYVTTADGVKVYAPDGALWGVISVPERPANCAFGGTDAQTLFITARTGLYRVALPIPGIP